MTKRTLLILALLALLAACRPPPEAVTIGIVNVTPTRDPIVDGFMDAMRDTHGYENVTYIYEGPIDDADERAAYLEELVAHPVDLIFAVTTPAAQTAVAATEAIPIVFAPITDPVGAGLVDSLAQPGGNATGITNGNPHVRRFELLLQAVPQAERVYMPYHPEGPVVQGVLPTIEAAAAEAGVELVRAELQDDAEVAAAIAALPPDIDAIFMPPDILMSRNTQKWIAASFTYDLPLSTLSVAEVDDGALMSYGEDLIPTGQQAARLANAILNGTAPRDLPVETTEYFLYVNLATAQAIGLDVPEPLLRQAAVIVRGE